jgi:dynactin 4
MLVSYTYRADDTVPLEGNDSSSARAAARQPETKTFQFYTVVELGPIIAKEDAPPPDF